MPTHRPTLVSAVLIAGLTLSLAACTTGAGGSEAPAVSDAPSGQPTDAPSTGAIEHPTGPTDVILQVEEGGGFVMAGFAATQLPYFTLYGDGTVIFRNQTLEGPPLQGSVSVNQPLRTTRLPEEQIQDLLEFALVDGGLAVAKPDYPNNMVADASSTIFRVNAGGVNKQVSVYALGLDLDPANQADAPARDAFSQLAARLADFDRGGTIPSDVFEPTEYRGILFEAPGMVAPDVREWPWPDLTVADFAPDADPNGLQFPHRPMTSQEIDALGLTDWTGGFMNLPIEGTDGKLYTLSVRPILPGETA